MTKKKSALAIVGLSVMSMVAFGAPALAEGSFSSSLSGVTGGFQTRRWTDNRKDNNATKTEVSGCQTSQPNGENVRLQIKLMRDIPARPDKDYGTKDFRDCWKKAVTQSWGKMTDVGSFYDEVVAPSWPQTARSFKVWY